MTILALLSAAAIAASPPPDPTAPTEKTGTAQQFDAQWRAAVAKFDGVRNAELAKIAEVDAEGPFHADFRSLQAYKPPQWYRDAKFGIFIHWGVFSVPAFGNEWYSREMYQQGKDDYAHHIKTYGPQARFGYKDFIARFKAEKFDPAAWAKLFREAGARYVVPVAEHHDGFAMYASKLSDWTAARMGPKRDVIGELETAVRAQGMRFGVSSHRAEHDWFFDTGRHIPSDVNDPAYAGLYGPAQVRIPGKDDQDLFGDFTPASQAWLDDWLARAAELEDRFHPDLVYFDWWIGHPVYRNTVPKFLAYYYNSQAKRGESGVVNYKIGEFALGSAVLDIERGQAPGIRPEVWQTDTSISDKSWGYIDGDVYKPPAQLIQLLADVVSKNGNLLLNIGPRADGTIPQAAQATLLSIGGWLKTNGEAIYGTRPWREFGEGPTKVSAGSFQESKLAYTPADFRFTTKGPVLYAIEMTPPSAGEVVVAALKPADAVARVTRLADGANLTFSQDAGGLHIQAPALAANGLPVAYRIDLKTETAR